MVLCVGFAQAQTPADSLFGDPVGSEQAPVVPAQEPAPALPPAAAPGDIPSGAAEPAPATTVDTVFGRETTPGLDQINDDPAQRLIDILKTRSQFGIRFEVLPINVQLTMEEGGQDQESVRLTNTGDTVGTIRGINALGSIPNLSVTHNCPPELQPGAFCDIPISFNGEEPGNWFTVLAINTSMVETPTLEVPISITVEPLPVVAPVPPVDPNPEPPRVPRPGDPDYVGDPGPKEPTPNDIARAYFGVVGSLPPAGPMSVVSLPDSMRAPTEDPFLGGSTADLSVERITQDPRYPESIASTEAGLPVDRDKILTSDRVIKAVLDTPFSNVMCGKVVAVVESDVYSATSAQPLIQAGSRVIGRCGELVKERAGIVWERILTVDGRSITLTGENSMTRDASGLGGALGRLYRTPYDRYILPIFGTGVDVAAGVVTATYGEDEQQTVTETGQVTQNTSARNEGIRTATEAVQGTAKQIITDMQDVREVLVVPAGSRIDIEIFEDIYFKDEREIVRIADTVYDVPTPGLVEAPVAQPDNIELVPYRPGIEGPVVTVNGRRFIVRESQALPAPSNTPPSGGGAAPTQPTAPGAGGRPSADSPTAPSTRDTLEELNTPPAGNTAG
jgi:Bacterial conjugation TrbI-like protein